MLDYSFDAIVIFEANGRQHRVPLSLAMLNAAQLLSKEVPFKVLNSDRVIYCTFDGEAFYADTRVTEMVKVMGVAFADENAA